MFLPSLLLALRQCRNSEEENPDIAAEVSILYELLLRYCKIPEDAEPDTPGSLSRWTFLPNPKV